MVQTESAKSLFHNANDAIKHQKMTLRLIKSLVMKLRAVRLIVARLLPARSRVLFLASTIIRIFHTRTSTPSVATHRNRMRIICQNSKWAPSHRCFQCKTCLPPSTNSKFSGREASGSQLKPITTAINFKSPSERPISQNRTAWSIIHKSLALWTITAHNQDLTAKIKLLTRY